jgi:hypothetical protein
MYEKPIGAAPETLKVLLDGHPIKLPAQRRSLSAIRTYLETLALESERVLCAFSVDGRPEKFSPGCPSPEKSAFSRVEGTTVGLTEIPLRMLETALTETAQARIAVQQAVTLVLINDGIMARELWWELARKLKEPLLTLSLLPETIYQTPAGCASLTQMRRWQLQQLAVIMKDVDEACWSPDAAQLSNALENRALPWLGKLHQTILLWRETVWAGARVQNSWDRDLEKCAM